MAKINNEYLNLVRENLFAIQTLYDIGVHIDGWKCDKDETTLFINGKLPDNELPDKVCRRIKKFYSYIFKKEFEYIDIKVDCEYDLNHDFFELHIYELDNDK